MDLKDTTESSHLPETDPRPVMFLASDDVEALSDTPLDDDNDDGDDVELKDLTLVRSSTASAAAAAAAAKSSSLLGLGLMAIAAFFFSVMSLAVHVAGATTPPLQLVVVRSVITLLLTLIYLVVTGNEIVGKRQHWPILFGRAVAGFFSLSCFYYALTALDLGDAVVLSFTNPVFTTLLAWLILGESLIALDFIGAALSLGGVVLISRPPFIFGESALSPDPANPHNATGLMRWVAIVASLVGAMGAALAYVFVRKLGSAVHAFTLVTWFSLFSIIVGSIGSYLLEKPVVPRTMKDVWLWLVIGVSGWAGQGCLNRGLQLGDRAGSAASMNYLQVVFAFLAEVFVLHILPSPWSIVGAALICIYALILVAKKLWYRDSG